MRYVKPDFYDDFKCIADKCPDTCCAGWQIMIDEEALEKYSGRDTEKGCLSDTSFHNRLNNSIDWQEGCFYQYGGRCAMLNEQNLCDLVIEKGEDWLCNTCNRYPRHIEEFEGLREMSLSLSCPVAAGIMLQKEEPMRLVTEEDETPDPLEEEFEAFDYLLFTQLEDARAVLFQIVQNRQLSIEQRMMLILDMAGQMQECVDEDRLFDMEDIVAAYADGNYSREVIQPETTGEQQKVCGQNNHRQEHFADICEGFEVLKKLERLREGWTEVLEETQEILYAEGHKAYQLIYNRFREEFDVTWSWDIFREQLLMFFLYTYFCGAVYDECIYSKAALAVFSVFYIQEFVMCRWISADKHIDKQECIRIAYRYAREVEHSDENLISLEEWLLEKM